ncbi:MAG: OmpA family protein [Treponema sp.]|jgi:outer membrane protein OmpA-like peptidoglycan-associated protein/flagellar hook assembly protein FlgD|nr:OmpA family protein [Treponema sp.]
MNKMIANKKLRFFPQAVAVFLSILCAGALWAEPKESPMGADAVPDLYAPFLAGPGSFTTTTGGAPASAVNPAQGGSAQRLIFDVGYLAIPSFSGEDYDKGKFMQAIEAGALFPTRYGVFGASLRYIGGFAKDQFIKFPIDPTFGGNIFASKEVYPGMSLGIGLNFGFGSETTISGDLGIHYNMGKLGPFNNFTWAFMFRSMGLSYFPSWLTPAGGVSLDLISIEGEGSKPDPFVLTLKTDLSAPSLFYPEYFSLIFKAGFSVTIAEIISLSAAWPGGSGLNTRELNNNVDLQMMPSIGLSVNINLPSGGERIAGGKLPSDGDLKIAGAYKPLYDGVTAVGGGVSWYVGQKDTTPPSIAPEYPETMYFSPNNDGKADFLEFPSNITDDKYVVSWKMEIKDEKGEVVRVIENKEQRFTSFNFKDFFKRLFSKKQQIDIPETLRWDGIRSSGELAPDGKYTFTITSTDDSGNTAVSKVYEAVVKNAPPVIAINPLTDAQRIFDPKAQGGNSAVTFTHRGSKEDSWQRAIVNSTGEVIRTFSEQPMSGEPAPQSWDGRDDSGKIAPDGVYSYRISATDKAQNSVSAVLPNIILDSREAGAFLLSSASGIAPKPNQSTDLTTFTIRLLLNDGIDNWKLELKDDKGAAQKTFSGTSKVPATQGWNGLDDSGAIREGIYTPELTVTYTRGDVIKTAATNITVDVTGPALAFTSAPEYFSPDNDGDDDELNITLSAADLSPITSWQLEIREPEPPYQLFRRYTGNGAPGGRIVWDGRSEKRELVQSATDYPYTYTAIDALGNSSKTEGKIGVDVLVIRDGDRLKIQIPSIVFRPNFADFEGLGKDVVDNNTRILRRIALILNKFRDYKVQVEGHANPTQPAGPARDREETELKRISEARAKAVVDLLVRYGVARNRLSSTGVGGSSPIVKFEDRDNWWKNRRVEFILIK